ncbi:CHAT domain-containing protein [Segetibacter sp. 3557_3]|uniref:DUF7379 domain-containing protein n=1 Tax=Segetibacter sp. 3557_3 TaxID=2547429 RepID=UPI001058F192|nr:CHAT domain-containing protein [Segetibacter sp. 3557_3]TDH28833.1 CHAT domain-containing protein [Segetibacter sp. 3557_3]
MDNDKVIISGNRKVNVEDQSLRLYFPDARIESFSVGTSRGVDDVVHTVSVEKNDVVVLEFENNIKWFYDSAEFKDKIRQQQPFGRGAEAYGTLVVPLQWQDTGQSRGLISGALKLLGLNVFKNIVGEKIAKSIAQRIEQNNPNILYQCDAEFNLAATFDPTLAKDPNATHLLLLHGTASSTKGSFEGLIKQQGGTVYRALFKKYGGRIIAFEHRTFTESPIRNVIALLEQLPNDITLDLLSHSRGGLVGEVLARIGSDTGDGIFTKKELALLGKNEEAAGLIAEIATLQATVSTKRIRINRFIRVACPAAGTTLVSDRMDTILNVLFNVLSNIGGETVGTIVDGIKALVTAVVNEKNDVNTLPGIECMRPTSNFIKALNFFETKINSDLVVIAGDAQGEGFVSRIKMFLVDSFYKEDNDLVVNTGSMKKGTKRLNQFPIYDERKSEVNHFNYFINSATQNIIFEAFAGKTTQSRGFYNSNDLEVTAAKEAVLETSRSGQTKANQPVLYVIPGLMGSHLEVDNERIWLNFYQVATGQINRLKLTANNVKAAGINGNAYKSMVDFFSNYYYVVPFAYDWRKSIFEAADELKNDIEKTLTETNRDISFVAHSMGGLVLKAFAIKYAGLWEELKKRSNCRVLLLGTPNQGSYEIPRLFLGIGKSINAIAAIDLANGKKTLIEQFVNYPGLLQLLPSNSQQDFNDPKLWNGILQASRYGYPVPSSNDLDNYLELQHTSFQTFQWDEQVVRYVAGKDEQTPSRLEVDQNNNKINFYATPRGDGAVTWDTIPPELLSNTYYISAEHGKLADHESSFAGYREILETGKTDKLSKRQPMTRSENKLELMPDMEPVTVTNENELSMHIMGITMKEQVVPTQQLRISITHGDMAHAEYPVVAAHFEGDGIVEAEKVLNQKLNNYFGIRYDSNNYPGKVGTHEIVFNSKAHPKGGIVVGLGEFGSLTENNLVTTLKQAFLSYIIKNKEDNGSGDELGISYLLIGTGFGGLTIYSSIKAVLTAVNEANDFFRKNLRQDYTLISHIEVIELYQHKAVQAGRLIFGLLRNSTLFKEISFKPNVIRKVSGARNEIPDEFQTEWWHRLKVYEERREHGDSIKTRIIKFSSITDKARTEEEVLATNISIVDRLVKQAASQTMQNLQLYDTLYEMLIPNAFKGYGSDLRNIVLIVDKETARYPWEMLRNAYSGNTDPIVTKAGFLRQLSTSTFRQNGTKAAADNALVIGNPILNNYYPNLPGAAVEASQVALQLKEKGYAVQDFIESDSSELVLSLYSRGYKIIHIAAHGVVNDKKTGHTGVVLGEELILTPSDFKQIRQVPELVFINCCSLGTIDKQDEERLQRKYEVAAGVGTQLIEMGVQAVIVAGWEVDDNAAQSFSERFYQELLAGRPFGESVRLAREATYKTYRDKNTWGAYQCYGDPFYSLRPISSHTKTKTYEFCDPVEAINKLQSLVSRIEAATSRGEKDRVNDEIDAVLAAINLHPDWKNDAQINQLLAELYKESGDHKNAITYYELLFAVEEANFSVRSIEQYCNIKIKVAVKSFQEGEIGEDEANKVIDECLQQLENLSYVVTAERYNMIASGYKRKAEVNRASSKASITSLVKAAGYYQQAYLHLQNTRGQVHFYPFYNWLILAALLDHLLLKGEKNQQKSLLSVPEQIEELMTAASDFAIEEDKRKPDFWNKSAPSTQYLYQLLTATNTKAAAAHLQQIVDNYEQAKDVEGSPKKLTAIAELATFISITLESNKAKFKDMAVTDTKIKLLKQVAERLG